MYGPAPGFLIKSLDRGRCTLFLEMLLYFANSIVYVAHGIGPLGYDLNLETGDEQYPSSFVFYRHFSSAVALDFRML